MNDKTLIVIARIATVIWAINGMWQTIKPQMRIELSSISKGSMLVFVLFYFLSAILILYLLREYERKN